MTLTTHAVVGAAAASLFPQQPIAAFAAGFVSHLLIDAIPHWQDGSTMLRSLRTDPRDPLKTDMILGKKFLLDLVYLGSEAGAGLALAVGIFCFWLFHLPLIVIFFGVCGGLLPDALHFVYFKTRSKLLEPFERFHIWIQREYPSPLFLSVEALLAASLIGILKLFY
jgi:hypothetical protein